MGKEDDADHLPHGQTISAGRNSPVFPVEASHNRDALPPDRLPASNRSEKVVCPAGGKNPQKTAKSSPQYIPQSGERYSAEAGKGDSAEAARLSAHVLGDEGGLAKVAANLARIERGFAQNAASLDIRELRWLGEIAGRFAQEDPKISAWAARLESALGQYLSGKPFSMPTLEHRTCEQCGDQFELTAPERGPHRRRFCDEPCRKKAERARHYARQRTGTSIGSLLGDVVDRAIRPADGLGSSIVQS